MEARTMSLPPAACHDDAERCFFAIELSKKSWLVAVNTPLSDKISRYTLKACDWKELLKLIGRIRTRVAGELKKRTESKNVEGRKNLLTGRASYKLLTCAATKGRQPGANKGHSPAPSSETVKEPVETMVSSSFCETHGKLILSHS
jgi:hypothetical protein